MKLIRKVNILGLNCNWIFDNLTIRPQRVQTGSLTSSTLVLHQSPTELCAQSPPVHSVLHVCTPRYQEYSIVKYADNVTISSCIINNDEGESNILPSGVNNLLPYISKTKEQRKKEAKAHTPVYISGAEVEQVNSFRSQSAYHGQKRSTEKVPTEI